jgi:hypothetical protein
VAVEKLVRCSRAEHGIAREARLRRKSTSAADGSEDLAIRIF